MNEEFVGKKQTGSLTYGDLKEKQLRKNLIYNKLPSKPYVRPIQEPPAIERAEPEHERQFISAVEAGMEGPLLRYSKRLELMALAEKLAIGRFQANLLIAEVQQRTGHAEDILVRTLPTKGSSEASMETTLRDRLFLVAAILILVALADLALIRFFMIK